jgi:GT2 family glycosyltransferase
MAKTLFDASSLSIIIVNYNSWSDLIECIESIYSSNSQGFNVIVCDNDSHDGSVQKLLDWVDGKLDISFNGPQKHEEYVTCKPKDYLHFEANGNKFGNDNSSLIVIETGANLGFAGGNNVGLRYALESTDSEYFWLLNADTTIADDAIEKLTHRLQEDDSPKVCGTVLKFYHHPAMVQALNGSHYNKWIGASKCIGSGIHEDEVSSAKRSDVESQSIFISGASFCVSRPFVNSTGLMEESYFLYYEEIDWISRSDKNQNKIGYADQAVAFHKEGGSIGSNSLGTRSLLSEYYLMASRVKFTAKFYPHALVTVACYGVAQSFKRLLKGQFSHAIIIMRALFGMKYDR